MYFFWNYCGSLFWNFAALSDRRLHRRFCCHVVCTEQIEAKSIRLPGSKGTFVILDHHEAFYSVLSAGSVRIHPARGEVIDIEITSGLVSVDNNEVLLNVNTNVSTNAT
ncbi:hypothetical protein COX00_01435 [Candidatus Uhrbacteria bacterium CG22_combo_CG10-13_8_21_14_all_47_17]|uniref:ATP synthase F1 complex delta/epsilon subunit N-terminal domain-containing protein n=1 Tax=Candidatus Uhrbacteria bacterium CG22_combo_CG10-13_8_21_14_all_47_17 TaxID=1975041 RepID=A0A2H0BTA3_9BACT|nr:MAG: hypothetical protein COX00_01435 [Candidatus Uhrbacteria bacterium CG22_combo_CG10-13_8_21_14_all_47_17]